MFTAGTELRRTGRSVVRTEEDDELIIVISGVYRTDDMTVGEIEPAVTGNNSSTPSHQSPGVCTGSITSCTMFYKHSRLGFCGI